jgi:hypothetical protein
MKVLVWNIEKFTDAKFRDASVTRGNFSRKRIRLDPQPVLDYMRQVFNGNGNLNRRPDVVAILEALAPSDDNLGTPLPANSPGADGLIELLANIKVWTGNNLWRLVPPLKCNPAKPPNVPWAQSEVVGVFYNSNTVSFDGPNQWIAGASQVPAAGLVAGNYPAPWNNPLVTLNTQNAGMVDFYLPTTHRQLTFPGAGNRRPFVVDFTELGGLQRTIRFGFVHTSPGFHTAGTREFAHVQEMRQNGAGDPAISIFAGDFNVNDYKIAQRREAFRPLQNQGFLKAFTKNVQHSTHYRKLSTARPNNWYDYLGHRLIDNFLVRHKAGLAVGAVAGYPKAAVDCAEGWPAPYVTTMHITIANLLTYNNPTEAFRWWENFWHIRKCSDHLPTFMNIT